MGIQGNAIKTYVNVVIRHVLAAGQDFTKESPPGSGERQKDVNSSILIFDEVLRGGLMLFSATSYMDLRVLALGYGQAASWSMGILRYRRSGVDDSYTIYSDAIHASNPAREAYLGDSAILLGTDIKLYPGDRVWFETNGAEVSDVLYAEAMAIPTNIPAR